MKANVLDCVSLDCVAFTIKSYEFSCEKRPTGYEKVIFARVICFTSTTIRAVITHEGWLKSK